MEEKEEMTLIFMNECETLIIVLKIMQDLSLSNLCNMFDLEESTSHYDLIFEWKCKLERKYFFKDEIP